jgi:hypothetical protein
MGTPAVRWFTPQIATAGQRIEVEVEIEPAGAPIRRVEVIADRISEWSVAPPWEFDRRYPRPKEGFEARDEIARTSFELDDMSTARRFPFAFVVPEDTVLTHTAFGIASAMLRVIAIVTGKDDLDLFKHAIPIVPKDTQTTWGGVRSANGIEIGVA